jgi:hypothetical protein
MTAVPSARDVAPADPQRWPKISWNMIGVIGGAIAAASSVVSAFASLETEVHAIREEIPPGAFKQLDERTLQIQGQLGDIKSQLDHRP